MKVSEVKNALKKTLPTKVPTFLWGSPGLGKSSVINQAAKELGYSVVDVRAALLDPCDLRGIPSVDGKTGTTRWNPPNFLPHGGKQVLFLDELPNAPPMVQNSLLQLALDRRVGEYQLPDDVYVVAAGNRAEDRSGAGRLIKSLANRFIHLDVEVDTKDWLEWAGENGIDGKIQAFINFRPNLLHDFVPTNPENAFPTPRSWAFLSSLLPSDPCFSVMAGCVGKGAAAEFRGFLECFQGLPSVTQIYDDPDTCPIPDGANLGAHYAVVIAAAERLKQDMNERKDKPEKEQFDTKLGDAYITYISRLKPECASFGWTHASAVTRSKIGRCSPKKVLAMLEKNGLRNL